MKSLTKLLALTATIVIAGWMNGASATLLAFTINETGAATVDTGDITAATATKTIPAIETVGTCGPTANCTLAGIAAGSAATFSTLTFNTVLGADAFTLTVGGELFTFSAVVQASITPTGVATSGFINEQFTGVVTSGNAAFAGQTVTLSESCSQTNIGAPIACSDTLLTPGVPIQTPEPASLALLGIGLAGLGFARRQRKS